MKTKELPSLNAHRVAVMVASVLSDELRRPPWRGHVHPLAGHCYVASEALWHLLGGVESGWKPQFIRHEGMPHWRLRRGSEVIDLTALQFQTHVDYDAGKGKGFLTTLPSQRARIVIRRVIALALPVWLRSPSRMVRP